jgi:hypothetical protein
MKYILFFLPILLYSIQFIFDQFSSLCINQTVEIVNGETITSGSFSPICDAVGGIAFVSLFAIPLLLSLYYTVKTNSIWNFKWLLSAWILITVLECFRSPDYPTAVAFISSITIAVYFVLHAALLFGVSLYKKHKTK